MKYYQNKEDKTYMGKTGRKYRDLYYDAYKEYIRKVMDEKNIIVMKQLKQEQQILFFWRKEKQSLF